MKYLNITQKYTHNKSLFQSEQFCCTKGFTNDTYFLFLKTIALKLCVRMDSVIQHITSYRVKTIYILLAPLHFTFKTGCTKSLTRLRLSCVKKKFSLNKRLNLKVFSWTWTLFCFMTSALHLP